MKTIFIKLNRSTEAVLALIMKVLLYLPTTSSWAISKIDAWADAATYGEIRYGVSCILQPDYAKLTDGKMCEYCHWCVDTGKPHAYCDMILKVDKMPGDQLLQIWKNLRTYDATDFYDEKNNITMDSWAQTVYSEISARELDWQRHELEIQPA